MPTSRQVARSLTREDAMTSNGSQRRWLSVRRYLNESRAALTTIAAQLTEDLPRIEAGLIAYPEWLPTRPVPLERVQLAWEADPPPPRVTGGEAESFLVRPLRPDGQRYGSYAEALADIDPPALLDDRPCYRLLDSTVDPDDGVRLEFGPARYFDGLNVAEAVAHELAAVWMGSGDRGGRSDLGRSDLPLRTRLGDPGDLAARTVVPAVCALTLRHDTDSGDASFLLHWRDPARVASGGGMYQIAPAGVFQPAGGIPDGTHLTPGSTDPDFDLWRCMGRELHEELLGAAEHSGLDYRDWPFLRCLDKAREQEECRPYYLGFGIDPLTFVADLMTVVVFDAATFDEIFADLVTDNAEGRVTTGVGFTEQNVLRYATGEPMQPAGAALLRLAWRHRDVLLG